jgi:colanic acid biosynthesis glycosyl transferase WcaI
MKILMVSLNHAPEQTGIGKYQGEMAAWFASQGHQVRAIVAPPYYPQWKVRDGYSSLFYDAEELEGVRVFRVPLYVPSKPSALRRLVHLASFALTSFPVLLWQALSWRPHVIVLTAPPLMCVPAVLLSGFLSRAKTHLHIQDFEVDAAFNLGLLKRDWLHKVALKLEGRAIRAFDTVSTISRKMLAKLHEKGAYPNAAFLIPNWANVDAFASSTGPGTWREGFGKEAILVVYSGNLGRKQGLETIVDAARLLQEHPAIRFVISGDGAGRSDMEAQANGLSNITFLPVQADNDFRHMMMAADVHLLPQRKEAADLVMPSKLGNILASGRPVVAGAEQGTQVYDAVQGCGIVVPPEDPNAFADAIKKLAGDANLRKILGDEGRRRAQKEWTKENALRLLEAKLLDKQKILEPAINWANR